MTWSGPTCWNIIRLKQATPRPPAAAARVVHTIAFAAVCELPVINSVLSSVASMVFAGAEGAEGDRMREAIPGRHEIGRDSEYIRMLSTHRSSGGEGQRGTSATT